MKTRLQENGHLLTTFHTIDFGKQNSNELVALV